MYKANYVKASQEPMVYLVSHTWNNRFSDGRRRATIEAYSNCDSVLLYNDAADKVFLGCKLNQGIGTHFTWEHCDIRYNVLRAVGYYGGKQVAEDVLILEGLEQAPNFERLFDASYIVPTAADNNVDILKGKEGYTYLYRINCGGDAYTDTYGQLWIQDTKEYSRSWGNRFLKADNSKLLSPYTASQRVTHDPIHGTRDWKLFQSFRFGRHELAYDFPLPDGIYRVELYFTEPWHGTGGSEQTDCEGLRIFDVAINGKTVIDDLDVWALSGHDGAYCRIIETEVKGGKLTVNFPEVKAGQALISAIAIAREGKHEVPIVKQDNSFTWASFDKDVIEKTPTELLPEDKNARATMKYEAEEAALKGKWQKKEFKKEIGVFFSKDNKNSITWTVSTGLAQVYALRFRFMNETSAPMKIRMRFVDSKNVVLKDDVLSFPPTPNKWRMLSTTTGTFINAGHYMIVLSAEQMNGFAIDGVEVQ